jgi:hypothetical protein
MIDWKKTKEKYGYGEGELPKTSRERVVWHCDNDNCEAAFDIREREYEYVYAYKKAQKAKKEGKPELCQKCSHSHRKGKVSEKREKTHLPLPPEVSVELTMERFGYDPYKLSPWSRKKLVLVCEEGQEHVTTRAQLNLNKSVKETGHYKPISWWTRKRRKGLKLSKETKEQMKESQQNRRAREKQQREDLINGVGDNVASLSDYRDKKESA